MGVLGLCSGDPIVDTLREVFHANIIRVPEQRYATLCVLAAQGGNVTFRGALANLMKGDPPKFPEAAFSQMTDIAGKKTKSLNVDLGLKILDGFLKGMGASSAGIDAKFAKVQKVTYSFANVRRLWVDDGAVGRILVGKMIDSTNPAAAIFFGKDAYAFLVLDSVITSNEFTIAVDKTSDANFGFDVPGIQNILGQSAGKIDITTATGYELTFKGATPLAFAFSCVQFSLSSDGTVSAMLPDKKVRTMGDYRILAHRNHDYHYSPDHVLLSRDPALLDIDIASRAT